MLAAPYTPAHQSPMQAYPQNTHTKHNGDASAANIFRSVKEQEAQFERLTRELEAERQSVSQQLEECRLGSETASMSSISSTDESFHWRGPQMHTSRLQGDESLADDSKMSSHLLDSCLRELEDRGTMNFGYVREDNMDYMHDDPYRGSGRIPYDEDPYNSPAVSSGYPMNNMNGGIRHNQLSPHSSHVSLQSTGSNRNASRVAGKVPGGPGSMSSLPHDQPSDNYMSYSSIPRNYEDPRGSPLPPGGSSRGPPTPTRSNPYQQPLYGSTQLFDHNTSVDSRDSFQQRNPDSFNHIEHREAGYPRSRNSYDQPPSDHGGPSYRYSPQLDPEPRYGDVSPLDDQYHQSPLTHDPQRDHSFNEDPYHSHSGINDYRYSDSPVEDRYDGPGPGHYGHVPEQDLSEQPPFDDQYRNGPPMDERYRGGPPDDRYSPGPNIDDEGHRGVHPHENDRLQEPSLHSNQFRESPLPGDHYRGHPADRYGDAPDSRFEDPAADRFGGPPDDRYGRPPDERYGGPPDERYGGPPDERYGGPHDDSYDERYRDKDDDRYGGPDKFDSPPDDRYRDNLQDQYPAPADDSFQGEPGDRYGPPANDDRYRGDYDEDPYRLNESDRRHEGLPLVQSDPFADDPFQRRSVDDGGYRGSRQRLEEDPYRRSPSPGAGSDRYGYGERPPQYEPRGVDEEDARPYYPEDIPREEVHQLKAPPQDDFHSDGRRTPSVDGRMMRWRNPDLQEVIDYLSHPSDVMKANAAAYLQHICFNDDEMKGKTRGLDGIPPLIELLNSDLPEVHKNACGALKNLSYGRANDDSKKAIKNAGGIPALIRLLRKTQDEDVKESVTGVLWNLSSSEELKKPIIDDGLAVLVNVVIIPHSGWDRRGLSPYAAQEPWTTVFRNATGVLRNVSSAGVDARTKLRECHGLVDSFVHTVKSAVGQEKLDNKPVENCVCTLRNLSYRIQEVHDPDFIRKRTLQRQKSKPKTPEKGESTGCFGGGGKKKGGNKKGEPIVQPDPNQNVDLRLPPMAREYQSIWDTELVKVLLRLVKDSSNPVTLEASAGTIQNLSACDWPPGIEIRAAVRKEKGLPYLVDLLTFHHDRVVCAAATALRNLALDERNKELIGKYGMEHLISNLPTDPNMDRAPPDDIICAVISTLYEIIKDNDSYAGRLFQEGGVNRLVHITRSKGVYDAKTLKHTVTILKALWQVTELQSEYLKHGFQEVDFNSTMTSPRQRGARSPANSTLTTPYSTMSRPISNQGYDDSTLSPTRPIDRGGGYSPTNSYRHRDMDGQLDGYPGNSMVHGHSNPAMMDSVDRSYYDREQPSRRGEDIPMQDIGPGYAPIGEQRNPRSRPPAGGVPLFINLPPSQPAPPQSNPHEPLYAQVNKGHRRRPDDFEPPSPNHMMLDAGGGQAGADSWV